MYKQLVFLSSTCCKVSMKENNNKKKRTKKKVSNWNNVSQKVHKMREQQQNLANLTFKIKQSDFNTYFTVGMLPGWGKPDMGCIMAVGGAPLVMGWGRGGGTDDTSGGDTPRGRGGRGKGGTAGSGVGIGAMGGMPKNIQKKNSNINFSFSRQGELVSKAEEEIIMELIIQNI